MEGEMPFMDPRGGRAGGEGKPTAFLTFLEITMTNANKNKTPTCIYGGPHIYVCICITEMNLQ